MGSSASCSHHPCPPVLGLAQSLQAQKVKEEEEEEVGHYWFRFTLCCPASSPAGPNFPGVPGATCAMMPCDLAQQCQACGHPKGLHCPRGTVGIAGVVACGDTAFLTPPCPQKLVQNYMTQTGHKLRIFNIWQVA